MALLAQRHRALGFLLLFPPQISNVSHVSVLCASGSLALRMRTTADSWQAEGASLESCCSASICPWHCSHRGTETAAACLSCHLKLQMYPMLSVLVASLSPAPKKQTSADSLQAERASLESCCSASSAHCTARTEAQRLGLLAFLATSKFKRRLEKGGFPARLLSQPCSQNENFCR